MLQLRGVTGRVKGVSKMGGANSLFKYTAQCKQCPKEHTVCAGAFVDDIIAVGHTHLTLSFLELLQQVGAAKFKKGHPLLFGGRGTASPVAGLT